MGKHIIISDLAPSAAPTEIGTHWIKTSAPKKTYLSVGTSAVSDWVEGGGGSGGGKVAVSVNLNPAATLSLTDTGANKVHYLKAPAGGMTVYIETGVYEEGDTFYLCLFDSTEELKVSKGVGHGDMMLYGPDHPSNPAWSGLYKVAGRNQVMAITYIGSNTWVVSGSVGHS